MKILVTGGSGFIAGHFVEPLVQAGHEIVNLDLLEPTGLAADHRYIKGDVRDLETVKRAMSGCQAVLNLAAAHHDFGISEKTFREVNVGGAENICAAMNEHDVKEACFYSTVAVYGSAPPPLDESTSPLPESNYGKTKLAAEEVFQQWVESKSGNRCLVIRPTVTFGDRNFANMFTLIKQIDKGMYFQVGAGTNYKSLSYVENIVDATVWMWFDQNSTRSDFDVFNYIDKPDMTSFEIAKCIYESLGKTVPKFEFPYPLARVAALPLDAIIKLTGKNLPISGERIKKMAKAETKFESDKIRLAGYQQKHELATGIRKMVRWYMAEGKQLAEAGVQSTVPPEEPLINPQIA